MPKVNAAKEFDFSNQPHDLEWMMVDTRRRQSEATLKLAAQTKRWVLRVTGLGAMGRVVKEAVIDPLRMSLLRRRTLADLQQLDDRLLADIGIERAVMTDVVNQLVAVDPKADHTKASVAEQAASEPVAVQNPAAEIAVVAPKMAVAPKTAANSNAASHRAA
ncbi:DUF1127 domain-containing protein [Pelagibius sp. Alg239-R121]|uniref:DUF1127 domain-containing protein n=1 Tax=Pelagibius sp. Alg239-R121 TaxID=2993448 RepID=UPI0024A6187A|nr:DUF1127 domain-containing protein [Pelagibius sp. Alg239-R121]